VSTCRYPLAAGNLLCYTYLTHWKISPMKNLSVLYDSKFGFLAPNLISKEKGLDRDPRDTCYTYGINKEIVTEIDHVFTKLS
jgi:hypothetical protein